MRSPTAPLFVSQMKRSSDASSEQPRKRLKTKSENAAALVPSVPSQQVQAETARINNVALILMDRGLRPLGRDVARIIAGYVEEDYWFNTRQLYVYERICAGDSVCVLGEGGSGKTYSCNRFAEMRHKWYVKRELCKMPLFASRESLAEQVASMLPMAGIVGSPVLRSAQSGQAVVNMGAGARTNFSMFGLYPGPDWQDSALLGRVIKRLKDECVRYDILKARKDVDLQKLCAAAAKPGPSIRRGEVWFMDEISLERHSVMVVACTLLREVRGNALPMGGLQLVWSGDWAQIPPVMDTSLRAAGYDYAPLLFEHKEFWSSLRFTTVLLKQNHRQGDGEFMRALNALRLHGRASHRHGIQFKPLEPWVIDFFMKRSRTTLQIKASLRSMAFKQPGAVPPLYLTSHNAAVANWNAEELSFLRTPEHAFESSAYVIKTVKIPFTTPDGKQSVLTKVYWGRLVDTPLSRREKARLSASNTSQRTPKESEASVTTEWSDGWNRVWKDVPQVTRIKERAPIQSRSNVDLDQGMGNRKRGVFLAKAELAPAEEDESADVVLPVISVHSSGVVALVETKTGYRPSAPVAKVLMDGEEKYMRYCLRRFSLSEGLDIAVWYMPIAYCYAATHDSSQSLTLPEGANVNLSRNFSPGSAYVALSRATSADRLLIENLTPECFGPDPAKQTIFAHHSAIKFYEELKRAQQRENKA